MYTNELSPQAIINTQKKNMCILSANNYVVQHEVTGRRRQNSEQKCRVDYSIVSGTKIIMLDNITIMMNELEIKHIFRITFN